MKPISFRMKPAPPFRLDLTAWALRRRPENIIDRWDGETYRRVLLFDGRPAEVEVKQTGRADKPQLQVTTTGRASEDAVRASLVRLLGTQVDLIDFYKLAKSEPRLGALVQRFRGVKPVRFPTVFECLVNAFACQQVSLASGMHLLKRLAERYGPAAEATNYRAHAFPRPQDLAVAEPEALREIGFSRQKARAVIELSQALTAGKLDLEALESREDPALIERLSDLRGVGRWTAEYALLRGYGRAHVFPGDDVGALNKMRAVLRLRNPLDYVRVRRRLAPWKSHAGLIYFHLLLAGLAEKGYLGNVLSRER